MRRLGLFWVIAVLSLACSSRSTSRSETPDAGGNSGTDSGTGGTVGADATVSCDAPSTCVQAPPTGWKGPVALYSGAPNTSPACPLDYPEPAFTAHGDPTGAPATCSTCACASPQVTCGVDVVYSDAACADTPTITKKQSIELGQCLTVPSVAAGSVEVSGLSAATGSCTATGGDASKEAPQWGVDVLGCSVTPPACAGGVCVPEPTGGFEPDVCVWQEGDQACPAGLYPKKRVFYQTFDDARGCTPCTCSPMQGASCSGGSVNFYPKDSCINSQASPTVTVASCVDADVSAKLSVKLGGVTTSVGTCDASGGEPTGTLAGAAPITVCCR